MNFIQRFGNFFLFFLLEFFALYLVAQYNKRPNEVYRSSANLFTGILYDNVSSIRKFLSIQQVADSLAKENAELKAQLEASKYIVLDQRGIVRFPLDTSTIRPDTAIKKDVIQQFSYIAAEVISNSIVRKENYLTINRGSDSGVKAGMGVVSPDGIVGIVRNVTPRFAQVASVLNERTFISAMIKRNRYFGSLKWRGRDPKVLTLTDIPKHAEIMKGDTIITSGFSEIFPGELRIGLVKDFRIEGGDNFYTLDVETWNDMSNIRYVYVVHNLMLSELQTFDKKEKGF
jgi:rod shape-determining protein MreC